LTIDHEADAEHLLVLLSHYTNREYRIVSTAHQTRTLNGRSSMSLRERNPDFSAAQSSEK
jgi:hypothetical protein